MLSPPRNPGRESRLVHLLRDLGADVHRGERPCPPAPPRPTGLAELDQMLGGGLPRGRLCEVAGPASSGRTSLAHALLARTTQEGHLAAWIDVPDAFDPASASTAGTALERVLWARPPDAAAALRSAERILVAGGFALVGIDLAGAEVSGVAAASLTRLRRIAAGTDAVLLLLATQRIAGPTADLAVEMEPARARFSQRPDWLEELEVRARLVRNRTGPTQQVVAVRLRVAA